MTILLLGKNGQVGWELQRSLSVLGEVVALDRTGGTTADGQPLCGDLSDLEGLAATVRHLRPRVIVNAAAHTAVDRAEGEVELATTLNARAPGVLAQEAARLGSWLVHYSTDYVFDGSGQQAWQESDPTGPLSVYGRTKLAGEQAVVDSGCPHLIFRTSWVYGARGGNFAKTMLRLAAQRERLTVINDQHGAPTGADLIADVTAQALCQALLESQGKGRDPAQARQLSGIYHLVASGETTWFDYARLVIDRYRADHPQAVLAVQHIEPVATEAFPTPAQRPRNSRLDTGKLRRTFGLTLPPWEHGVQRLLATLP